MQSYLNPEGEQYLDWFHITMRITVLGQYAKGLDTAPGKREEVLKMLESTKHYLWHGNMVRAQEKVQNLHCYLDNEEIEGDNGRKMRKGLDEFDTYIAANQARIPKYGERWRNEEAIATGFVESVLNQIVSERFAKRQQMQWTKKGAHLRLQTLTPGVSTSGLRRRFRSGTPDSGRPNMYPRRRPPDYPEFYAL